MKKKTFWWLFIGSNLMMVLSTVVGVMFQDRFETTAGDFGISCMLFLLSVIFLFEIRSVCFGGKRPNLGSSMYFLRKHYEEENLEKYVSLIKRILLLLWVIGAAFFGKGIVVFFIKLLLNK